MGKICMHCIVSGRVQGVFYRREAYGQAIARELTGWAKNLADGSVEVMLCGEQREVELLRDWLWEGPAAAKVVNVESQEVPWQTFKDFEVL